MIFFGAYFLAAPFPLSLFLFRFVVVSMGVGSDCFWDFLADDADNDGDAGVLLVLRCLFFRRGGGACCLFLRRGGRTCFPLFRGPLPPPGHLGEALLVACFGLDLTRALSLRLLAGGGCCGCCILGFLGTKHSQSAYTPSTWGAFPPPPPFAGIR